MLVWPKFGPKFLSKAEEEWPTFNTTVLDPETQKKVEAEYLQREIPIFEASGPIHINLMLNSDQLPERQILMQLKADPKPRHKVPPPAHKYQDLNPVTHPVGLRSDRYSSFSRLILVIARTKRAIHHWIRFTIIKKLERDNRVIDFSQLPTLPEVITPDELDFAEESWVRALQGEAEQKMMKSHHRSNTC